jgi:16S rRNA G966 N2-methylase RsmD
VPRHFLKEALLNPEESPGPVRLVFSDPPYFNPDMVERIINQLERKELLVKAGLDEFDECEKLAFRLLYESGIGMGRLAPVEIT